MIVFPVCHNAVYINFQSLNALLKLEVLAPLFLDLFLGEAVPQVAAVAVSDNLVGVPRFLQVKLVTHIHVASRSNSNSRL